MVMVDLATRILPRDHKIWKLFPGEGYKFARAISDSHIAFLDVRNLANMPPDSNQWKKNILEQRASIDRWTRQNEATGKKTKRVVSANDKRVATYIDGLFNVVNRGDLIVVPNSGPDGLVNIYEIADDPGSVAYIDLQDGRNVHRYVGRKIYRLDSINKRDFPYGVVEQLQTPVPFFDLGNSGRNLIYERAFGNYIYRENYFPFIPLTHVHKKKARLNRRAFAWLNLRRRLQAQPAALEAA